MRERFNQIFGHVAFLPAGIGFWVLADCETGDTWMFFSRMQTANLGGYKKFIHLESLRDSLVARRPWSLTEAGRFAN